jgi:hypothetical protein
MCFDWVLAHVGFLTIAYREERETWAAELGGFGSDTRALKETLTVTFIKRSYIILVVRMSFASPSD